MGRRPIVEARPVAQGGRAGPGDADGLGGDAVGLGGGQDVGRGEAPGAVDQDADAEALALAGGDAFDPAALDRDALLEPADERGIGVCRALGGAVSRARSVRSGMRGASLAEGTRSVALGCSP